MLIGFNNSDFKFGPVAVIHGEYLPIKIEKRL